MLYILPTVVLQVKAYLYYETINKTILSFLDVTLARCVFINILGSSPGLFVLVCFCMVASSQLHQTLASQFLFDLD